MAAPEIVLIVGLGNPGKAYERSRHNLGFQVVERLGEQLGLTSWKTQHQALVARGQAAGRTVMLAKPQTYMNRSGQAVQPLLHYYKVPLEGLLVVTDDLDLAPGKVRQRTSGSDGGHKGLRSIIQALGTPQFKRIRIGIGRPPESGNVVSFVLGASKEEQALLDEAVALAAGQARAFIDTGTLENWSSG